MPAPTTTTSYAEALTDEDEVTPEPCHVAALRAIPSTRDLRTLERALITHRPEDAVDG
jgi:hypothetical protein